MGTKALFYTRAVYTPAFILMLRHLCSGRLRMSKVMPEVIHESQTAYILSWGFWKLFPTGTYAIIGTTCVEFENVMKSTTEKKIMLRHPTGV